LIFAFKAHLGITVALVMMTLGLFAVHYFFSKWNRVSIWWISHAAY